MFYQLIKFGQIEMPNSNLRFQNSVFGYIVTGSITSSECQNPQKTHCGFIYNCIDIDNKIKNFWQLDSIGIRDDPSEKE